MTQSTTKRTDAEESTICAKMPCGACVTNVYEAYEAGRRAAIQPAGELLACANCLRPKCEHNGKLCPSPFTTHWHAWDYAGQTQPTYPEYGAAQQDEKAGQLRASIDTEESMQVKVALMDELDELSAAPEGKTEASELPSEWMLYADAFGGDPESIDYDSDKWQYFTAGVTAALAARPPVAAAPDAWKLLAEVKEFLGDMHAMPVEWTIAESVKLRGKVSDALSQPSPAVKSAEPSVPEVQNIARIERPGDQSVGFTFLSARSASAFARFIEQARDAAKSAEPTGEHPAITVLRELKREDVAGYVERGFVISTGLRAKIQAILEEAGEDPFQSAEPTGGAA